MSKLLEEINEIQNELTEGKQVNWEDKKIRDMFAKVIDLIDDTIDSKHERDKVEKSVKELEDKWIKASLGDRLKLGEVLMKERPKLEKVRKKYINTENELFKLELKLKQMFGSAKAYDDAMNKWGNKYL